MTPSSNDTVISFAVDERHVEFRRNWMTGRAELSVDGAEPVVLQSPRQLTTHFSVSLEKVWRVPVGRHDVVIRRKRALLFAGLREATYEVSVDGVVTLAVRAM